MKALEQDRAADLALWLRILCISLYTCLLYLSHYDLLEVNDPEFFVITPLSSKCSFHLLVQDGCLNSSYLIHNQEASKRKEVMPHADSNL